MFTSKPLDNCYINQLFGDNMVPYYKQMGLKGHNGLDFHADMDTPCYAVFDGKCIKASTEDKESLSAGRFIWIESNPAEEDGVMTKYQAVYFHLNHVQVKVGDSITSGQQIGLTGNSGQYTTGPHLHFGTYKYILKDGQYVNPNQDNGYGGAFNPEKVLKQEWLANSAKKQLQYDFYIFEGKILKEQSKPECYLVQGQKLRLFTDELALWTNNYSLSQVTTVSDGAFEEAVFGEPIKVGNKIDAQILKEMIAIFGNEPDRAKTLFSKYF